MAIYILDGYAGSGKTAYAVRWMRGLIKRGTRVFSDVRLFPSKMGLSLPEDVSIEGNLSSAEDRANPKKLILYWRDFWEWSHMKEGTILCDEGGVKFNARGWDSLPPDIQNKIMQHRHERLDLVLTTPHWTRVDVMIRQMTARFLHFELKFGSSEFKRTFLPRIARMHEFHLEDMQRAEHLGRDSLLVEAIHSEWFWIREKLFDWYDTGELVGLSLPTPEIRLCKAHRRSVCLFCEREKEATLFPSLKA